MVLAEMFGVALIVSVFRIPANAIDHRAARGERDAASKVSRGAGADANDLR
jgi:hypothetical protein